MSILYYIANLDLHTIKTNLTHLCVFIYYLTSIVITLHYITIYSAVLHFENIRTNYAKLSQQY